MIIKVTSADELTNALQENGLTPTPLPQADTVEVKGITIIREVVEREFGCGHQVSTTRFIGEDDYCAVCDSMQTVAS